MKIDFTKPIETLDGTPLEYVKESCAMPGTFFVRQSGEFGSERRRVDSEGYRIRRNGFRNLVRWSDTPIIRNRVEIPKLAVIDWSKPLETLSGKRVLYVRRAEPMSPQDPYKAYVRIEGEKYEFSVTETGRKYAWKNPCDQDSCPDEFVRNVAEVVAVKDFVTESVPAIDWSKPLENYEGTPAEYLGRNSDRSEVARHGYPHSLRIEGEEITVTEDGKKYKWETLGKGIAEPKDFFRNVAVPLVDWSKPLVTVTGAPVHFMGHVKSAKGEAQVALCIYPGEPGEYNALYTPQGIHCGRRQLGSPRVVNKPDEIAYAVRDLRDNKEYAAHSTEQAAVDQIVRYADEAVDAVARRHKIVRYVNGKLDTNWKRAGVVHKVRPV